MGDPVGFGVFVAMLCLPAIGIMLAAHLIR